jgi:branched-chain amino acid aminotransferase
MKNIDWENLPFGYLRTNCNVRAYYKDGKWSDLEICESDEISVSIASSALHYGQECFEGMKAFRGKDGKIRIFRLEENAKRMYQSAEGIMMQAVPVELFSAACIKVLKLNEEFVPPFESGASLYFRPFLIGTGAQVGVAPSKEYTFIVFVTPVGPYSKTGFNPIDMQLVYDMDRAAPLGTGRFKVGGNYASSLRASERAKKEGFNLVLFADAAERKYIDEAGPANFFGIKGNNYITPKSDSILQSITNMSLRQIATDLGLTVEQRPVPVAELPEFDEVGACGTAAVIMPVKKIVNRATGDVYEYCKDGKAGKISTKLYETLRSIQYGEIEDKHHWNTVVS